MLLYMHYYISPSGIYIEALIRLDSPSAVYHMQ
jgi:hypothetical protein